jgi:hypothetical protein
MDLGLMTRIASHTRSVEIFWPQCRYFQSGALASNQTDVLISISRLKQCATLGVCAMSHREKLNLAALAFGLMISVAWTAFLGFAMSKAIEWLL